MSKLHLVFIVFLSILAFEFAYSGETSHELTSTFQNPYQNVNWEKYQQVCSTSHIHITTQEQFNFAYSMGLRHFAASNYFPSVPYYPLSSIRTNQFAVQQEHPIMVNGQLKQGPFKWNYIILDKISGWYTEIDSIWQKKLPFKIGEPVFKNIQHDIITSPNAEHHNFTNTTAHINSLGSFYCSGTFDVNDYYKLSNHGYAYGAGIEWQKVFSGIIKKMQFRDGGGIIINHPKWRGFNVSEIYQMLDFDNRVLGIEIWNESRERADRMGFALDTWDEILATGRRCYGFAVPDHHINQNWKGRNYLLVPKFNEKECLKAYREGRFYCALLGNGLRFEKISFYKGILSININKPSVIKVISDKGIIKKNGKRLLYEVPFENGKPMVTYIRVEAEDNTGEIIFSQPLMFKKNVYERIQNE